MENSAAFPVDVVQRSQRPFVAQETLLWLSDLAMEWFAWAIRCSLIRPILLIGGIGSALICTGQASSLCTDLPRRSTGICTELFNARFLGLRETIGPLKRFAFKVNGRTAYPPDVGFKPFRWLIGCKTPGSCVLTEGGYLDGEYTFRDTKGRI